MADDPVSRRTLSVQGQELSYLHAGEGSPLLLLHGTYWSRVWAPVIPRLAQDHAVFALDYPGFGRVSAAQRLSHHLSRRGTL